MPDLPLNLFANPVWHALQTRQRHFAVCSDATVAGSANLIACRFPADVVPFAAVLEPTTDAMRQLHSLIAPGESLWLIGERFAEIPGLSFEDTLECFQMVMPFEVAIPGSRADIVPLSNADAPEMVALTTLAFPGFFRARTCEMGAYYGVRSASGELIAMGGERMKLNEFSELSAVCTHPAFRGHGFATSIMWQLIQDHRRDGLKSFLHVACTNLSATALYERMGFEVIHKRTLHRISRHL
jgi:GNAT superfamily N-acetyltransferase